MEPIIGQAAEAPADLIKDTDTQHFVDDVIQASRETPVLVDFWAPWCGPCKQLTPILEKVVKAANGKVRLVKINIDDNPQVAQQLQIQSIPAVFAFSQGQPVDGFVGVQPESRIRALVERLAGGAVGPSPIDEALEQARAALEAGEADQAGAVFSQILQHEPENPAALGGLARCLVTKGELEAAREVLAGVPKEHESQADVAAARAALDLRETSEQAGDIAPLRAAVEASPNDHQARYDLALALYAAGDREGAVDALLTIIEHERAWNDEAARKQLLKLFEAFGPTDPLTVSARRRLSSILFS